MKTVEQGLTYTARVRFEREEKGTLVLAFGEEAKAASPPGGRVPKLARLMALAIRFDGMLARGEARDYAELARVGHVTRARVTQIMNLLRLAPDIQEAILFLPLTTHGNDAVKEWQVRPIAAEPVWRLQRASWRGVTERAPLRGGRQPRSFARRSRLYSLVRNDLLGQFIEPPPR